MLYLPILCFGNIEIYEGTRRERDETGELLVRQLDSRKIGSRRRHIYIYINIYIIISFISILIIINIYIVIVIFIYIIIYIMHCKRCICIRLSIGVLFFPTFFRRISALFHDLLILLAVNIYLLAYRLECNAYT